MRQQGHHAVRAPLGIGEGSAAPGPCRSWWERQMRSAAQEKCQAKVCAICCSVSSLKSGVSAWFSGETSTETGVYAVP
jgi:hypothetical protein